MKFKIGIKINNHSTTPVFSNVKIQKAKLPFETRAKPALRVQKAKLN